MDVSKLDTRLFINNEFVPGKAGRVFKVYNPTTEEVVCDVHEALKEDVDLAVQAAQAAFPSWSEKNAFERSIPLAKLAQLMLRDAEELATLDALSMGKPIELGKRMDIPGCAAIMNYYCNSAYHVLGQSSLNTADFLNVCVRQPYGVVGLIIPWNVPLIMFAYKIAPAVICGNTTVLKPSEKAPLSTLKMAALIKEAGFPPGVINIVNGFGDPTGRAIAEHMKIRKIAFTGSVATGRLVMKMAADSNLKDVTLELGGKSPAIIFEDANLPHAVRATHFAINHNSGQHCQANSRILVHESIADKFVEELVKLMEKVEIGDPLTSTTFQGPQGDQKQLQHILRLIEHGKKDGTLVCGGVRHGDKGAFVKPTIFKNVPTTSPIYEEEVFGPVVIINTFREEAEALQEANSVEYGLFSAVFTQNFERALRVSKKLESGAVGVNCSMPIRALDMPIGGWKQSGIGDELAIHGLNAFTELKSIYLRYAEDKDKASGLPYNWHNGA